MMCTTYVSSYMGYSTRFTRCCLLSLCFKCAQFIQQAPYAPNGGVLGHDSNRLLITWGSLRSKTTNRSNQTLHSESCGLPLCESRLQPGSLPYTLCKCIGIVAGMPCYHQSMSTSYLSQAVSSSSHVYTSSGDLFTRVSAHHPKISSATRIRTTEVGSTGASGARPAAPKAQPRPESAA